MVQYITKLVSCIQCNLPLPIFAQLKTISETDLDCGFKVFQKYSKLFNLRRQKVLWERVYSIVIRLDITRLDIKSGNSNFLISFYYLRLQVPWVQLQSPFLIFGKSEQRSKSWSGSESGSSKSGIHSNPLVVSISENSHFNTGFWLVHGNTAVRPCW